MQKQSPSWQESPNFWLSKSYHICDLKPHKKFQNPMITPSGRKVTTGERKEKMPFIVDTKSKCMKLQRKMSAEVLRENQLINILSIIA
jgi:hypothetical protein